MNKLDMESKDIVKDNLEYIRERFPEAVTEENGELKLNPDSLIQSLSSVIIDDKKEKYELTWPGKKEAIINANTSTRKTLRPVISDSLDFEKTKNIYIEGDNIEALKILQESYLHKVKCIYIDPPYNRGSDLLYKDNYHRDSETELIESGLIDENGNKLITNSDSNGRFHSDWLTMMYSRLKLARNLLTKDGVIFISIDDNEQANLKKICDEIFGENNFVNCIAVKMSEPTGVKMSHANSRFPKLKEYILFYKMPDFSKFEMIDKYKSSEWDKENNIFLDNFTEDDRNKLIMISEKEIIEQNDVNDALNILKKVHMVSLNDKIKQLNIPKDDIENWCFENCYRIIKTCGSESLYKLVKNIGIKYDQEIACALSSEGILFYYITNYNEDVASPRLRVIFADDNIYKNPCDFWQDIKTSGGIAKEGGVQYNNGKKPLKLLKRIIKMTTGENDIILDFFSGSASTAHAVLDLNKEDGKNRHYIMVQIDENLDESANVAVGDTKKTIQDTIKFLDSIGKPHLLSELGKERLRRTLKIINSDIVDCGFRVYKIDESNMKDEFYLTPDKVTQEQIKLFENNIKEDRTPEDLLTQVILNLGLKLDLPIEEKNICGNKVFDVDDGELLACFDDNVSIDIIEEIAKINPRQVVFRDSSFATDQDKVNFEERLKRLSAGTKFNVL